MGLKSNLLRTTQGLPIQCLGNACITVPHSESKDRRKNPQSSLCTTTTKVKNLLGPDMSSVYMLMKLKANISANASCGNTQVQYKLILVVVLFFFLTYTKHTYEK